MLTPFIRSDIVFCMDWELIFEEKYKYLFHCKDIGKQEKPIIIVMQQFFESQLPLSSLQCNLYWLI